MRKLALVACLAACVVESDEVLDEAEQAIVNGSRDYPSSSSSISKTQDAVVWIQMSGTAGCTGILVARDIVLTSTYYCGWGAPSLATGAWMTIPPKSIKFGYEARTSPTYTATATAINVPPLAGGSPNRIALLKLIEPVPWSVAVPRPVYIDRPFTLSSSSRLYQFGFGGSDIYTGINDRKYVTGSYYRDWTLYDLQVVNTFQYTSDRTGDGDEGTNFHYGDIGGPVILDDRLGFVIGVLDDLDPSGVATFGPGGTGRSSVRDWLQANVPQKPDFDAIAVAVSGCSKGHPTIKVTVKSVGARSGSTRADIFVDRNYVPTGTLSSIHRTTTTLAPEQTTTMTFALPESLSGYHEIHVTLDATQTVDEIDEFYNNATYAWVTLPSCNTL